MYSESDESSYTVHEPQAEASATAPTRLPVKLMVEDGASAVAPYYSLGTTERHAFEEKMRRLREQAAQEERDRHFLATHPFQPQRGPAGTPANYVTPLSSTEPPPSSAAAPSSQLVHSNPLTTHNCRPVFDRLAAQAAQLELRRRHREEQQRRAEAAALRGAFRPHINPSASPHDENNEYRNTVPVEERLLNYGEYVARERQRRRDLKALEEKMAQESFSSVHAAQPYDPKERRRQQEEFQQRNDLFLSLREQHLRAAEAEAVAAFSFKPKISATSVALDESRHRLDDNPYNAAPTQMQASPQSEPSVNSTKTGVNMSRRSDILYAHALARQRGGGQGQGAGSNLADSVHGSFNTPGGEHQPMTNPLSERWIANSAHRWFFQENFVRRQALYDQVKREESTLRIAAAQEKRRAPADGRLLGRHHAVDGEPKSAAKITPQQLAQRLYYDAKERRDVAEQRRQMLRNPGDCLFRPQLAPGTRQVLRSMSARDANVVRRLTSQTHGCSPGEKTTNTAESLYVSASPRKSPASVMRRSFSQGTARRIENDDGAAGAMKRPHSVAVSPRRLPESTNANAGGSDGAGPSSPADMSPAPQQARPHPMKVTRDQIEHFYQRQMQTLQHHADLIREHKDGKAVQELAECTFRPRTNTDAPYRSQATATGSAANMSRTAELGASGAYTDLSRVTGVSSFLQRQQQARRKKVEQAELLRRMGLPRNKSGAVVDPSTGTTVITPFALQTEQRRLQAATSPSRASSASRSHQETPGIFSAVSLTSTERALHDSVEASRQHPPTTARASLFPLPGYTPAWSAHDGEEEEEDAAVSFEVSGDNEESLQQLTAPSAERHMQTSLFSSLSPTTLFGRSLRSFTTSSASEGKQPKGSSPRFAKNVRSASAMKNSTAPTTTGRTKHRRHSRSVSFLDDRIANQPAASKKGVSSTLHIDAAQMAFLHGEL